MSPSSYKYILQCFFAEFFSTGIYLFAGCMGCLGVSINNFQISLHMALVIMIAIQCFGHISGAHLNPVVTVAAYISDVVKLHMVFIYFLGQLCGSVAGFGLLKIVSSSSSSSSSMQQNFCMTLPSGDINELQIFIIEFVITSILIFVCCAIWDSRNIKYQDSVSLRIGLTVGCLIFSAINLSGGSMNPVRSFAPALWHFNFDYHWIYWVAPLSSSVFTSIMYKYFFKPDITRGLHVTIHSPE